jgi:hypothetical protein
MNKLYAVAGLLGGLGRRYPSFILYLEIEKYALDKYVCYI